MDKADHAMAAWEHSLRPSKSIDQMWLLIGIVVALVLGSLAYLAFNSGPGVNPVRAQKDPQGAPSAAPQAEPPARQDARLPDPALAPRVQRFSKCTSASGAIAYSDGPCPTGAQAAQVAVHPDSNLADGMSDDARQASLHNNSVIAQSVAEHERRVAMNVDTPTSECAQLKALIASIDAAARQPLPGFEQDRLKDQRRRANDRMFALRCA
ncbi:hypothetical protein VLK31_24810 [Variovorax sp. H27-G14]|uniref:hypothetical protein n=1 Tax=Variovorax sp. H27-G14 TaxID=3111914 RepID=UPI0038FCE7B8